EERFHRRPDVDAPPEASAEAIKSLQQCVDDVASLLALPAAWKAGEPSQIVETLLDVLVKMLDLDVAYASVSYLGWPAPIETLRVATAQEPGVQLPQIRELALATCADDSQHWPVMLRAHCGGRDLALVLLRLGMHDAGGLIVTGSHRADFPRPSERLLLSVA